MKGVRLLSVLAILGGAALLAAFFLRPHAPTPVQEPTGEAGRTREVGQTSTPPAQAYKPTAPRQAHPLASTPYQPPANPSGINTSGGQALLGSVVAPTQASLSVRMPLRITRVLVTEGQMVLPGQRVIDLDETEARAQERTARAGVDAAASQVRKAQTGRDAQKAKANADVETAQNGLRQAQSRLQQARLARQAAEDDQKAELRTAQEGVRKAAAGRDRARETLRGLEDLARVGGVSRSDLEGARTQLQVAQSDLDTAQAQVDRLQAGRNGLPYRVELAQKDVDAAQIGVQQARDGWKGAEEGRRQALAVADQDILAARAALSQAAAGLAGAQAALRQTHLVSPIEGLAANVTARAGETAQPGVSLATIVSLNGLRVEALVPARLLVALRVGQPASISVDTLPGRAFAASISEIARIAEPDGRTFRVKFRLLEPPALRPGQTARILLASPGR